jgi:ketosteroid isomerase-like protein
MTRSASTDIVMAAFAAVEQRDERRLAELYHPEVEFHWPPSLPYGGTIHGAAAQQADDRTSFDQVWDPLQPTSHERCMDPRVAAGQPVLAERHGRTMAARGCRERWARCRGLKENLRAGGR